MVKECLKNKTAGGTNDVSKHKRQSTRDVSQVTANLQVGISIHGVVTL